MHTLMGCTHKQDLYLGVVGIGGSHRPREIWMSKQTEALTDTPTNF